MIDRADVERTYPQILPWIRVTPTIRLEAGDFGPWPLVLKLELLQHAGAFKTRGAFANLLLREIPPEGVAAASGGNHGAAVAYAASRLGRRATIFVPEISSPAKVERIRSYGAELVIRGARYSDALEECERFLARSGALSIHAFDQRETLMGAGSVGLEFLRQAPDLDTILVAVGGGGLIGGVCAWSAGAVRVVGVEPEAAPTLTRALEAGEPVDAPTEGVAADSLAPRRVGTLVLPLVQRHVDRVLLVSDASIRQAQQTLWDRLRVVTEPGAAAPMAALMSGAYTPAEGERVGVVLSGGNTDAVRFTSPPAGEVPRWP